jgi:hypothetical protein
VAHTTVTTQIHETFDVHGQRAAQIAFHRVLGDLTTNSFNFGLGEIFDLHIRLDTTGVTNLLRRGTADSVNGRQRDYRVLLWWNVNPGYSSHESYLLNGTNRLRFAKRATIPDSVPYFNSKPGICSQSALPLLVAAILADNTDHALATDNFAITTNAFYRGSYFHGFTYIFCSTAADRRGRGL